MIKPASLWALMKTCDNSKWIGDICRALGGQLVDLDYGQQQMVSSIKLDSGWMDERVEAQRERWRERQRKHRDIGDIGDVSRTQDVCDNGDIRDKSHVTQCHVTSVRPSVPPSVHPSNTNITRSVTVTTAPNGNGNGTGDVDRFKKALASDQTGGSVIFSPEHDPVVIAIAITGDARSQRRWRQACANVGEDHFREELFSFYREIRAGEDVGNRGAALNARLKRMEGGK